MCALYPHRLWRVKHLDKKKVFLTFDDGPHPVITPWVLDLLKEYNAQATFFCIGNNVVQHQTVFERIIAEGHSVGNHTYHHLNGWKNDVATYLQDIEKAEGVMKSRLFRPPYGKMTRRQEKAFATTYKDKKVVMWDVLSGDFDTAITGDKCFLNVKKNVQSGSIIVFHDSEKAFERLSVALPLTLLYLAERGFHFAKL